MWTAKYDNCDQWLPNTDKTNANSTKTNGGGGDTGIHSFKFQVW